MAPNGYSHFVHLVPRGTKWVLTLCHVVPLTWCQVVPNGTKWVLTLCHVVPLTWCQVVPSGTKWYQMGIHTLPRGTTYLMPSGTTWYQMGNTLSLGTTYSMPCGTTWWYSHFKWQLAVFDVPVLNDLGKMLLAPFRWLAPFTCSPVFRRCSPVFRRRRTWARSADIKFGLILLREFSEYSTTRY